jgi:hypothetical protein
MPAMNAYHVNNVLPEFVANLHQLLFIQFSQISRRVNCLQERAWVDVHALKLRNKSTVFKPFDTKAIS